MGELDAKAGSAGCAAGDVCGWFGERWRSAAADVIMPPGSYGAKAVATVRQHDRVQQSSSPIRSAGSAADVAAVRLPVQVQTSPQFAYLRQTVRTNALVAYARGLDTSHPITFINGGAHAWRVQELIDVICVNWAKYQWYDPVTYLDAEEGSRSIAALEQIRARYPEKPVIITEFGGAEAQAGWHNWGNVKWSEEFQARNVEDSGRYALEADWVSGGCVWQFSDTRTAPDRILAGRLHGWNGKGIVMRSAVPNSRTTGCRSCFESKLLRLVMARCAPPAFAQRGQKRHLLPGGAGHGRRPVPD